MINVAALDPSTLTLWLELRWLRDHPHWESIGAGIDAALRGDMPPPVDAGEATIATALFSSAVWHENRHFMDLLLTNYGWSRIWQFFSIHLNATAIMSTIHSSGGRIAFPLEAYQDPFRLELLGLQPNLELERVARDVKKRADYFELDEQQLPGGISVGGQAQLEALAYYFQGQAIFHTYGNDIKEAVDVRSNQSRRARDAYLWPILFSKSLSIPVKQRPDRLLEFNLATLPSILIATLSTRSKWESVFLSTPSGRLAKLLAYSDENPGALSCDNWVQAWEIVNEICISLFGHSAIEELRTDHKARLDIVAAHKATGQSGQPIQCIDQLLSMRTHLLDRLENHPETILDPEEATLSTMRHTHPIPIVYEPDGMDEVPEGFSQVFGYSHGAEKWTWAFVPNPTTWPPNDALLAVPNIEPWFQMIDTFGPLAKLVLKGLHHRTAIGPELNVIQTTLKFAASVEIVFESPFDQPPDAVLPLSAVAELSGQRNGGFQVCEICKKEDHFDDGKIVSPWNVWARAARYGFYDGESARIHPEMEQFVRRDWSPIFACVDCYALMQRANHLP